MKLSNVRLCMYMIFNSKMDVLLLNVKQYMQYFVVFIVVFTCKPNQVWPHPPPPPPPVTKSKS